MINYDYQHAAHVVDWRMYQYMRETPLQPMPPRTKEDMEFERAWSNYQDQLEHGWIKK